MSLAKTCRDSKGPRKPLCTVWQPLSLVPGNRAIGSIMLTESTSEMNPLTWHRTLRRIGERTRLDRIVGL